MPIYCYRCPRCDATYETIKPMSQSDETEECWQCAATMERDMSAEGGAAPVGCENANTFWSDSLAINPDQIPEHRRLFPDIPVDSGGRPGFTSHKQRERYIEVCGFEKKPAKLKR